MIHTNPVYGIFEIASKQLVEGRRKGKFIWDNRPACLREIKYQNGLDIKYHHGDINHPRFILVQFSLEETFKSLTDRKIAELDYMEFLNKQEKENA